MPAIFGDHMVLQRGIPVPVWGWADPNEKVTVTAGETSATATTGTDGKWRVALDKLTASDKPISVAVAGKNTVTISDVLVGDVWVCSGQSNMEFNLGGRLLMLSASESAAKGIPDAWTASLASPWFGGAHDAATEVPKADHPTLRLFIVKRKIAYDPQEDCTGAWVACTPATAARFSAVGYFFGRDILDQEHVPVGMIGSYWGGTAAESWTSLDGLKSEPSLAQQVKNTENTKAHIAEYQQTFLNELLPAWQKDHDAWEQEVNKPYQEVLATWRADAAKAKAAGASPSPSPTPARPEPRKPISPYENAGVPTVLTNGMIAPIVPYAIKGAIWYQGEANAGHAKQYETVFPTLIRDWRTRWGEGDFPFIWVQLANFMERTPDPTQTSDGWPGLRDAQTKTLSLPNTGQAVIIDIGADRDIHPKDKSDVGQRLALAARHVAYGEDLVYSGPTYDSIQVEGAAARVKFKNVGTGLIIGAAPSTVAGAPAEPAAAELKGFSIAGEDQVFYWAKASIDGDGVVVSCPEVKEPKAVRYGWANNPEVNLYNKEGLPACPFRTDDWVKAQPTSTPRPR